MKIVFFTEFYPYGQGEEFLENEMKIAEQYFDKITIVSFNKSPRIITKYIPSNAGVIPIRSNIGYVEQLFRRIICLFSFDVWRETAICVKERGWNSFISGLKRSILEKSLISLLIENEHRWAGKYDVYYSYWLSGLASYLALRKTKLMGTLISRAHGYDCFYDRGYHVHRRQQFENIDLICSISDAGKEDLIAQGCDPSKIKVSRLGVEKPDDKVNPYKETDTKRIVTCSNIVNLKRLDLLIEALGLIDNVQIEWVHFGDGALREEIERLAEQKLSGKKNIRYVFKGRVQLKQIFEYYASESIDCFINCSDVEGIPVSIMEAMSYGIPCIARNVGGNGELVSGNNGILLPASCSAKELKTAIEHLLSMAPESNKKLRKNAFDSFDRQYNASRNYADFFENLLGQEAGRTRRADR